MQGKELTDAETHFRFGENWASYSALINDDRIAEAESGLIRLWPGEMWRGASFLDIGCGSGLHALAAARLGVRSIYCIDIDQDSVSTTRETLSKRLPQKELSDFSQL